MLLLLLIQSIWIDARVYAAAEADFIDGAFIYKTLSKKASADIRYKTVGWYIHLKKTCTSDDPEDYTAQCDPTSSTAGARFKLEDGHQLDEDVGDEDVLTVFKWTEEEVKGAIGKEKVEELISEGMPLYASAIMKVVTGPRENPTDVSGPYHTLQGIVHAASWMKPSDLRQYYDVRLTFHGDPGGYPLNMIIKLSNGTVVENKELGKYNAGTGITKSFPKEIDYNGRSYEIFRSWLSPVIRPGDQLYIQDKDRGDSSVIQRNFKLFVGGTNMVAMYREKYDPPDPPKGGGACKWTIEEPDQVDSLMASSMDPGAQGHILSDDNANGRHFDATLGIPTSEYLYANTWAMNYLFQHTFGQMKGNVVYECKVDVTYQLKWLEKQPDIPGPDGTSIPVPDREVWGNQQVNYTFSLEPREYTYWQINNLEVYKIEQATMENYALPGGQVLLRPNGYTPPSLDLEDNKLVTKHVFPKETGEISFIPELVFEGGYSPPTPPDDTARLQEIAESQTKEPDVKNDSLLFQWDGQSTTVMDGSMVIQNGPKPGRIPEPTKIGSYKDTRERVLFSNGLLISNRLLNKAKTPSTGTIYYSLLPKNVGGSGGKEFPVNYINNVTVHTPVVNYSSVYDDAAHNQKTKPNERRSALILERPFTVKIPTSGQHLNESSYPGYGNRDYAKYFRSKQVRFEFDVYMGESSGFQTFVPKGTWIEVPVKQEEATFFLPVWVDEGDYQVYFRNIAENAPGGNPDDIPAQDDANLNLVNHMALDQVSVEVIGRLYDFHITDIADYNWESVFRQGKGAAESTGVSYWVGMGNIDGNPRGNLSPYSVLIRPGSHPFQGYKNVSIKTGYHFKFDLKTKGNMFGKLDGIRITPTFYFVSHDGSVREQVDLYYSTNSQPFVKIGSKDDKVSRYVILNERLRNVPLTSLQDTASYKYYLYEPAWVRGQKSLEQYTNEYVNKVTLQKTPVGGYNLLLLPEQLRTMIGPKKEYQGVAMPQVVDAQRANASIQQWYGEYSLPAAPYIVKAGESLKEYHQKNGKLDDKSQIFLQNRYKNGYILVNFDIESIRDGKLNEPHLQYIHAPEMNKMIGNEKRKNQWEMEGFQSKVQDAYGNMFELKDGDMVLYHANKSSRDDFQSLVTH